MTTPLYSLVPVRSPSARPLFTAAPRAILFSPSAAPNQITSQQIIVDAASDADDDVYDADARAHDTRLFAADGVAAPLFTRTFSPAMPV